jgi:Phage integrase, N-terminal SAM-like domain
MKVSLYVREHSSRNYRKATPKEPAGTIYVLRYGSTWETTSATNWTEANVARLNKQAQLFQGWVPPAKVRPVKQSTELMLDAAMDQYLGEIKQGRKKKTFQAYSVALRYFYECIQQKPIKEIQRPDLIRFAAFLRDQKEQSPRSAYNKFESVMTFLKHFDVKPKIRAADWPQYVEEEPEMYEQEILDKFFAACDEEETLLFEFFLQTGLREQEVILAPSWNGWVTPTWRLRCVI